MSRISKFLIKCSGANSKILGEIPQEYIDTEQTKFTGVGGAIFFTSFLAFISSTFALTTFVKDIMIGGVVIEALYICLVFGLIWALMIFNLDRYIVSSMRKKGDWRKELLHASPRIFIALLFAIVISKPLELEIFGTEIEAQLPKTAEQQTLFLKTRIDSLSSLRQNLSAKNDTLLKDPYNSEFVKKANEELSVASGALDSLVTLYGPKLATLQRDIQTYRRQRSESSRVINTMNKSIESLQEEQMENNSINNSARIQQLRSQRYQRKVQLDAADRELPRLIKEKSLIETSIEGVRTTVEEKEGEYAAEKKDINLLVKKEIEANRLRVDKVDQEIEQLEEERKLLNEKFHGLLARLKALEDLKHEPGNGVIWFASILVFLVFLAIETAPVFVKLISNVTLYDQILEEFEKPIPNKSLIKAKVEGFYEEDALRLTKEKAMLRDFYSQKNEIQEALLKKSLEHIEAKELERFEKNQEEYSAIITDRPKEFIKKFKSDRSPLTRYGQSLHWEKDQDLVEGQGYKKLLYKGAFAAATVLVVIFSGVQYFVKLSPKNETDSVAKPSVAPVEENFKTSTETGLLEATDTSVVSLLSESNIPEMNLAELAPTSPGRNSRQNSAMIPANRSSKLSAGVKGEASPVRSRTKDQDTKTFSTSAAITEAVHSAVTTDSTSSIMELGKSEHTQQDTTEQLEADLKLISKDSSKGAEIPLEKLIPLPGDQEPGSNDEVLPVKEGSGQVTTSPSTDDGESKSKQDTSAIINREKGGKPSKKEERKRKRTERKNNKSQKKKSSK